LDLYLDELTRDFILRHRVARLATVDASGAPSVVPICYAFDGDILYTPIDEKPKRVSPLRIKRVRNILANPKVALVIDDYSENWDELSYVMIRGLAEVIEPAAEGAADHSRALLLLRDKYPQYRAMALDARPIIKITPTDVRRWSASLGS
jgi:PPOX class probable F420-dependent enzyme